MCNYGMLLLNSYDYGIKKDIEKGKEYLKKSADLDYSYAQIYYCCTLVENEPSPSEIQEAIYYIKESMKQNNAYSFYIYGILIEEGKISGIDDNLAYDYFKRVLDMGYNQAKIKCDEYIKDDKIKNQSNENEIKQYKWKSEIILNKLFQQKLNTISKIDHSFSQIKIQSENNQNTDTNSTTIPKQFIFEHFVIHEDKNMRENSSIKTKKNDETYSLLRSQVNEEEDPLIFKFDDFASHTDDLIEIAKIIEKSDPTTASKIYKKTLQDGNLNSVFKCFELSATFQEKLYYLQLAVEKIPGAFCICRKHLLKEMSLRKDKEEKKEIAKIFEKFEDYSDAAYVYNKIKDEINCENCYNKAIENIEKIEDDDQLYIFGIVLKKKNNLMLSLEIFQKSHEKRNPKAKNEIDKIKLKIKSLTPESESSIKDESSTAEIPLITEAESSIQKASLTKEISLSSKDSSTKDDSSSFVETFCSKKNGSSISPEESEEEVFLENPEVSESLKSTAKTSSPSTKGSIPDNSSPNRFQLPIFSISNFNEEVKEEKNQKEISSITKLSIIKETLSSSSDSLIEEILSRKETQSITEAESSRSSIKLSTNEGSSYKSLESFFLPRTQTPSSSSSLSSSGSESKISSILPHRS